MKNLKSFHNKLMKESSANKEDYSIAEAVDKDLAKEDALSLVSEFVKDVKKRFPNKQDKLEILRDVAKTLDFYINEIENTSSIDIMSVSSSVPTMSFDDVSSDESEESEDEDLFSDEE